MSKKVFIYSTPTCPFCRKTKQFLQDNNIEFTDYDVSSDHAKAEEMVQKSGQMGVPVLDIEGEIVVGFDKEKIEKLLDLYA